MAASKSRKKIHLRLTVHSIFYAPYLATAQAGFLEKEGLAATLGVVPKGTDGFQLLRDGQAHVFQNAPSRSLTALEKGEKDIPLQVAGINNRDGFYIVGRKPTKHFQWRDLEGQTLIPSAFAAQPLASLRLCLSEQGVNFRKIKLVEGLSSMEEAEEAFRRGRGDYVHLQNPNARRLVEEGSGYVVASVGKALGPIAFSSLAMSRKFLSQEPEVAEAFMRAYVASQKWIAASDAKTIVEALEPLFSGASKASLVKSVEGYRVLRAWLPNPIIPRPSYERALNMWILAGYIKKRYPYEAVVYTGLAEKVMGEAEEE